jgi:hypothetical protein
MSSGIFLVLDSNLAGEHSKIIVLSSQFPVLSKRLFY